MLFLVLSVCKMLLNISFYTLFARRCIDDDIQQVVLLLETHYILTTVVSLSSRFQPIKRISKIIKEIPSNEDSTRNTKPLINFTVTEYMALVPTLLKRLTVISTAANAENMAPCL